MNTETRLHELGDYLEEVFAADLQRREAGVLPAGAGRGGLRSWFAPGGAGGWQRASRR